MSVAQHLTFTKPQLKKFAHVFKTARQEAGVRQIDVARAAFQYKVSHCKVSRVERAAMPKVDAHCLERMARVLGVPRKALLDIDPQFQAKASVARAATSQGLWGIKAQLL